RRAKAHTAATVAGTWRNYNASASGSYRAALAAGDRDRWRRNDAAIPRAGAATGAEDGGDDRRPDRGRNRQTTATTEAASRTDGGRGSADTFRSAAAGAGTAEKFRGQPATGRSLSRIGARG